MIHGKQDEMDRHFLSRATELAAQSLANGGFPCGAIVALGDGRSCEGLSSSSLLNDPTAHAEVLAIRKLGMHHGYRPEAMILYSTLEPCLMCISAAHWAKIGRVVFGCRRAQVAAQYYEGSFATQEAVAMFSPKIEINWLHEFEGRQKDLIKAWEASSLPLPNP